MNEYSKLILVAAILVIFGTAMVAPSSYKILFDKGETMLPTSGLLPIQANSSSDFVFWYLFGDFPKSDQVLVVVSGSYELQGLLNSTLNYNSTMDDGKDITISIVAGNQSISAIALRGPTPSYEEPIATSTFDIPSDWWAGFAVRVSNPENYPVVWTITVILYGHVIDTFWIEVLIIGIGAIILGLATFQIANNRKKKIEHESNQKSIPVT
jgi:hypothetical protein